ncbi:hypothetical protein [Nonomuraea jabiensis]|uniref:hypothetical protein n=1 Tax=Nonomuraea jabiensis TaxID=882448 RepID=UPI003D71D2BF
MPMIAADLSVRREPCARRTPYPVDTVGCLDASYNDICAVFGDAVLPPAGSGDESVAAGVEWVIETAAGQAILFDRDNPFDPQLQSAQPADWHVWGGHSAVLPWIHHVVTGSPQTFASCLAPSITAEELLISYADYLHHRASTLPPGDLLATQLILQRNDMIDVVLHHEQNTGIHCEPPDISPVAGTTLPYTLMPLCEVLGTARRHRARERRDLGRITADQVDTARLLADKAPGAASTTVMVEYGQQPNQAELDAHKATLKAMATALAHGSPTD